MLKTYTCDCCGEMFDTDQEPDAEEAQSLFSLQPSDPEAAQVCNVCWNEIVAELGGPLS